jgi:PAS domain S-box-containing protein
VPESRTLVGALSLDEVLESIPDPVVAFDRQFRYTYVSRRAASVLGLRPQDMLGRPVRELLPWEEPLSFIRSCERAWDEGRPVTVEQYSSQFDRWSECYICPLASGAATQWRDITERKRTQDALRESEAKFRATFANATIGVATVDLAGRFVDVNPAYCRITGYTEAELRAMYLNQTIHPDDVAENTRQMELLIGGEQSEFTLENRYLRRDGSVTWVRKVVFGVEDRPGHPRWIVGLVEDVTERRRQEEVLTASRHRFRSLFENTQDAVFCATTDGTVEQANAAASALFGWSAEEFPGIRREWMVVRNDPRLKAFLDERARAGHARAELEFIHRDGRHFDGEASSVLVEGEDRAFVMVRDITERKDAERRLRESQERLAQALETARAGSFDLDLRAGIGVWSEEFQRLYGIAPTEHAASLEEWFNCVFEEDRERVRRELLEGLLRGEVTTQFRIRRADTGEVHWMERRGRVLRDDAGDPIRLVGFSFDITEQKHTEEALATACQRLDAHMDNSPLAVVEFDPSFRVTRWSKEAERLFGWTSAEILGRAIDEERWVHEEDAPRVRALLAKMVEGEQQRNTGFNRNHRKDGSVVECEWYNSAIHDAAGRLTSILSQALDVTSRRQAEERLRQAQKLESLGLLAGGVAHDFNNLLVGVVGNASLALEMLPPHHPVAELLEGVLKSGEKAAHLTRQMLAYSGKGRFHLEALNLSEIVPEMIGLVRPSMSKKIVVELDLAPDLPPVEADRGQIQQVFMNLAMNASEAIGAREGTVSIRTAVESVDDSWQQCHPSTGLEPGQYVRLEVSDTGCGMDDQTKARVFDPFFSTKFTGRGLGLAAVAGIVRGHKGAILVDGATGRGSTFAVLLPVSTSGEAVRRKASRPANPKPSGAVLVVDDEPVVCGLARRALEQYGFEVLEAPSGEAAIDILKRHPGEIGVILLDLSMPGMSGEEALPELRRIRPAAKVVVSSGYSESEALDQFQGQRISGFIQKPYTVPDLVAKVKAAMA